MLQLTLVLTFIYSYKFTEECWGGWQGQERVEKTTPNLPLREEPPQIISSSSDNFPPKLSLVQNPTLLKKKVEVLCSNGLSSCCAVWHP